MNDSSKIETTELYLESITLAVLKLSGSKAGLDEFVIITSEEKQSMNTRYKIVIWLFNVHVNA